LSYWPVTVNRRAGRNTIFHRMTGKHLLRLLVDGVLAATWTVFPDFHPIRIVAAVFLRRIIPLLAFTTSKGDNGTDVFLF